MSHLIFFSFYLVCRLNFLFRLFFDFHHDRRRRHRRRRCHHHHHHHHHCHCRCVIAIKKHIEYSFQWDFWQLLLPCLLSFIHIFFLLTVSFSILSMHRHTRLILILFVVYVFLYAAITQPFRYPSLPIYICFDVHNGTHIN